MDEHDTSYKLLFSHDRMVRDLLTGFLPREWITALDLGSPAKPFPRCTTCRRRTR